MKRFIPYFVGLLIVVVAALLINDFIWFKLLTTSTGSSAYKVYRIYGHHPDDEIPVFGSSRAQAHFDPEIIGENCFNYGLDASGQNETLDLLEEYLKRSSNTTLPIIINLDPWGFPNASATGTTADYALVDGSCIGVRSFGKFRTVFTNWLSERTGGTKKISKGAILQLNSRTDAEWDAINSKLPAKIFNVSEYWKARITKLSTLTSRKIYWVVGPCAPYWKEIFKNESGLNSFCDWLNNQPNQVAINMYALPYDNSYFMDPIHLNVKGAASFSKLLSTRLTSEPK